MYSNPVYSNIFSTSDLKKHNLGQVYLYIYEQKQVTQNSLIKDLNMSAPTINQYLTELQTLGLVEKKGLASSNGGRRPNIFQIINDARVSVGLEIVNSHVLLIITDLYGEIIFKEEKKITFDNSDNTYFDHVSEWANSRIHKIVKEDSKVLGIGIAAQGLPTAIEFTMGIAHLPYPLFQLRDFSERLNYPCNWVHDVELAAQAEIMHDLSMENFFFISLNREVGSALVINRNVHTGAAGFSSLAEHMILHPNGRSCYCGKNGCMDAYCSAYALSKRAGESITDFFNKLRMGFSDEKMIWDEYLHNLAIAIDNVRMIARYDILLGGEVESYMTEEDISLLVSYVEKATCYKSGDLVIRHGYYGRDAAAIGGSFYYIEYFLKNLGDF